MFGIFYSDVFIMFNIVPRSDSHLAIIPALPPKSKPFLPPKQMIGRSKEDVERINQVWTYFQGLTINNSSNRSY